MKKVIFVCLLSLSVCLSQAAQPEKPTQDKQVTTQNPNPTDAKTLDTKTDHAETAASTVAPKSEITKDLQSPNNTTTATNGKQNSNETSTKNNETKPTDKPNSNETTKVTTTEASSNTEDKAKENKEAKTTVSPTPPSTGTTADKDNKKNETTTPKGENVSPTAAVPVEAKSRAFDGPSFIGGIILTLGLLAIGFMGFKYYKNQTERNYHTL